MNSIETNQPIEKLQALNSRLSNINSQIQSQGYNLPGSLIERVLSLAGLVDQAITISESGNNLPDNLKPGVLEQAFTELEFDLGTFRFSTSSKESIQ